MTQQVICLNCLSPLNPFIFFTKNDNFYIYEQSSRGWESLHAGEQLMRSKLKNIGNHPKTFQLEKELLDWAQVWI